MGRPGSAAGAGAAGAGAAGAGAGPLPCESVCGCRKVRGRSPGARGYARAGWECVEHLIPVRGASAALAASTTISGLCDQFRLDAAFTVSNGISAVVVSRRHIQCSYPSMPFYKIRALSTYAGLAMVLRHDGVCLRATMMIGGSQLA